MQNFIYDRKDIANLGAEYKIVDYTIVYEHYASIDAKVKRYLNNGWYLFGFPITAKDQYISQAMIKVERAQ